MLAGGADQPEVEGEVVDGAYLEAEDFLGADEVVEVGEGVDVDWVLFKNRPKYFSPASSQPARKEKSVAAVAGGHDAVEHVNAAFDGFE